jgi:putative nucleotidyltransferase with HDIG domain
MWPRIIRQLQEANKELWLFLMMFAILAAFNYLVASDRMMLGFYVLPTVFSAYFYGRRHATLTALASVLLVILIVYLNPRLFTQGSPVRGIAEKWWDITIWGGTLMVTAYAMGTLYEKKEARVRDLREANKELRETHEREEALISELRESNKDLRETHGREEALISELRNANKELHDAYNGVLLILQRLISDDEYTYRHSIRVVAYADTIAEYIGFDSNQREVVKAAAMLHDIGKLKTSSELLYRAARFTASEYEEMKKHVQKGVDQVQPVGGLLRRIIPIILAHHDRFDGSGYHPTQGEQIPLEARIIAVADVYDAMTSDRPYAKAMSPLDAKEVITKGSGTDFDPAVVKAFLKAYQSGALEVDFTALDMHRP